MGGGASTTYGLTGTKESIVRSMMPTYFDPSPIELEERLLAEHSWSMIMRNKAPEYMRLKKKADIPFSSCADYFFSTFFRRLLHVNPGAIPLFNDNPTTQNNFLIKMISLALVNLANEDQFVKTFSDLAAMHNRIGVRAVEYGMMGDVLFWSLEATLGSEFFSDVKQSWVKIFSQMLAIMVPIAVAFEQQHGSEDLSMRNQSLELIQAEEHCRLQIEIIKKNSGALKHPFLGSSSSTSSNSTEPESIYEVTADIAEKINRRRYTQEHISTVFISSEGSAEKSDRFRMPEAIN